MTTNNSIQAAWVAVANFISVVFVTVIGIVLARVLSRAEYGTYRQVLYLYNTMLIFLTLGLPKAYVYFIPRIEPAHTLAFIRKMNKIMFFLGLIFATIFLFGAQLFAKLLNNADLSKELVVFSVIPILLFPTLGTESIFSSFKKTSLITIYALITNGSKLVFVVLAVFVFKETTSYAIFGLIIAALISFLSSQILVTRLIKNNIPELDNRTKIETTYKEIISYTTPILIASIFGIISTSIDQIVISRYFGTEVFADFANGSTEIPLISMVVSAGSVVLAPLFSRQAISKNPISELFPLWISSLRKTILITYPIIIFCFVNATEIMILLFGKKYAGAGNYFSVIIILSFFRIVMFAPLLLAVGKQRVYSNAHLIQALLIIILEGIAVKTFHNPLLIIWISTLVKIGVLIYFGKVVADYFETKIMEIIPVRDMILVLLISFACALLVKLLCVEIQIENHFFGTIINLCFFGLSFFGAAFIFKLDYMSILKPFLIKSTKK